MSATLTAPDAASVTSRMMSAVVMTAATRDSAPLTMGSRGSDPLENLRSRNVTACAATSPFERDSRPAFSIDQERRAILGAVSGTTGWRE
jgi:hypothetical protein